MKKSAKPLILALFFTLVVLTTLVLIVVATRFKYEELVREKDDVEKRLKSEQTRQTNLIAEFQMQSSQRNIVRSAQQELGMIQDHEIFDKIIIDNSEVESLSKFLEEKYD